MLNAYLLCATVGMAFMVLSALLGWMGAGHGNVDASGHDAGISGHGGGVSGHDGAHAGSHDSGLDTSLPLFSPMTMAAYVTGFGGAGLIFRHLFGDRPLLHVPAAAVSGVVLGLGAAYASVRLIGRFESGRVAHEAEAYGQDAEVTVAIPAEGFGEVAYVAAGVRQAIPARAEAGVTHAAGEKVRIVRIVAGTAHVRGLQALDRPY